MSEGMGRKQEKPRRTAWSDCRTSRDLVDVARKRGYNTQKEFVQAIAGEHKIDYVETESEARKIIGRKNYRSEKIGEQVWYEWLKCDSSSFLYGGFGQTVARLLDKRGFSPEYTLRKLASMKKREMSFYDRFRRLRDLEYLGKLASLSYRFPNGWSTPDGQNDLDIFKVDRNLIPKKYQKGIGTLKDLLEQAYGKDPHDVNDKIVELFRNKTFVFPEFVYTDMFPRNARTVGLGQEGIDSYAEISDFLSWEVGDRSMTEETYQKARELARHAIGVLRRRGYSGRKGVGRGNGF